MIERYTRRLLLGYGAASWTALALSKSGSLWRQDPASRRSAVASGGAGEDLPEIEGPELVTDPSQFPTQFAERPEFAEMVQAGTLPPVAERIGQDPLVLRPIHGIGTYGGTIRRAYIGVSDQPNGVRFCSGPDNLLYWDMDRREVVPNMARDFELSDNGRELILQLRRGMHWSDGTPFTAEDILFWRNDISLNTELLPSGSPSLRVEGQDVTVEKVDDYTVRFLSPAPRPLLPAIMASISDLGGQAWSGPTLGGGYAPKHYLSQFHPAYTSDDEANRLATDAGFNGWTAHLAYLNSWGVNPDLPCLSPWITTRSLNDPPWVFGPNPYSIWVDTDGNQLPYIGEVGMQLVEDRNLLIVQATNGEFDFQDRHLDPASLPVLLENQERGRYTIHRAPKDLMDFGVKINLAYDTDPVLGELIRTTDFRRALSLGIERDQLNEAFFVGASVPTATLPPDDSLYFPGAEWRTRWATHDIEQANALLDGIGLTERDGSSFRIRPDGNGRIRLDYQATTGFADFVGAGEMIAGQWADIGITLDVSPVEGNALTERALANELMLSGHGVGTDDPFLRPDNFLPTNTSAYLGMIGIPYARWYASGGTDGVEPPPSLQALKDAMDLYYQGLQAPEEERNEIGKELYRRHVDEAWTIGCLGYGLTAYGLYLANNDLRNVPARVKTNDYQKTPLNTFPMTFSYES